MNTFLDFLSDNTFFAIFSGIIVVLVLAFIVTLIKGKKGEKKPIEDVTEENYMNIGQEFTTAMNETPNIENVNYETSIETQMMGSNSADTGYQAAFTNYIPDLNEEGPVSDQLENNIPDVNFETSMVSEPIIPEAKEIEMPVPQVMNEEPAIPITNEATTQSFDAVDSIFPDFSAKEEVDVEPIVEASEPDEIEMPIPITETPELAFASLPTEDNTINENIKIETTEEYDYEKTEIFDFPDFSKTEIDSEKVLVDVEKVVMEAANKYIDSVMKS